MGKFATALLSIVFQLYLTAAISADEQVRRVQEELRKRHLFYGNITGEMSPSLTTAITRYQAKKGIRRTGRLDSETCASLGVAEAPMTPPPANTPSFVVADGDVRNANGEAVPSFLVAERPNDQPNTDTASPTSDAERIAAPTSGVAETANRIKTPRISNSHSRARPRRTSPPQETNPFVLAFRTVDHAMKAIVNDTQPKTKRVAAKRPL